MHMILKNIKQSNSKIDYLKKIKHSYKFQILIVFTASSALSSLYGEGAFLLIDFVIYSIISIMNRDCGETG